MTAQSLIRKLETGLTPLGAFRARAMFGGHGLYLDDRMFGLIYADRLYLKADDENRPDFERAKSEPFVFESGKGRTIMTSHWLCPPAVLKDVRRLQDWVGRSVQAARRAKARKPARKSRPRPRRARA